jgi:hypothetical protein
MREKLAELPKAAGENEVPYDGGKKSNAQATAR